MYIIFSPQGFLLPSSNVFRLFPFYTKKEEKTTDLCLFLLSYPYASKGFSSKKGAYIIMAEFLTIQRSSKSIPAPSYCS